MDFLTAENKDYYYYILYHSSLNRNVNVRSADGPAARREAGCRGQDHVAGHVEAAATPGLER